MVTSLRSRHLPVIGTLFSVPRTVNVYVLVIAFLLSAASWPAE
jgi:hypothetical protein